MSKNLRLEELGKRKKKDDVKLTEVIRERYEVTT